MWSRLGVLFMSAQLFHAEMCGHGGLELPLFLDPHGVPEPKLQLLSTVYHEKLECWVITLSVNFQFLEIHLTGDNLAG